MIKEQIQLQNVFRIIRAKEPVEVKSAKVIVLKGDLSKEDIEKIKGYYINPVDSREVAIDNLELYSKLRRA